MKKIALFVLIMLLMSSCYKDVYNERLGYHQKFSILGWLAVIIISLLVYSIIHTIVSAYLYKRKQKKDRLIDAIIERETITAETTTSKFGGNLGVCGILSGIMFAILFLNYWYIGAIWAITFLTISLIIDSAVVKIASKLKEAQRIEEEKKANMELRTLQNRFENQTKLLIDKYGAISKKIDLKNYDYNTGGSYDINNFIFIFEEAKRIYLVGCDLSFSDILACSYFDDQKIIKGKIIYKTKTDTKNMAKRAVVGGALLGSTGVILGGTTSQKTSVGIQEEDQITHNYTITVNVNDIINPIIRIPTGQHGALTNEIVALLNVVIARKG